METTPATYNFDPIVTGDTFAQRSIVDGELVITPYQFKVNFDLTGFDISMKFMKRYLPDPVKTIATESGITITAPTSGEFKITPFIVDWASGIAYYVIKFTKDGVSSFIKGIVPVLDDYEYGSTPIVAPSPITVSFIFPKGEKGDKGDPGDPANFNQYQVTVETYAEMLDAATGELPKVVRVLIDENKGMTDTEYTYYPDGRIMWTASIAEERPVGFQAMAMISSKPEVSGFPVTVGETGFPVRIVNAPLVNLDNLSVIGHWDCSSLTGYADNALVPVLADASGFGNHLVQRISTQQPIKQMNDGMPVLSFDGTKRLANASFGSNTLVSTAQDIPFTIAMVVKVNSTQTVELPAILKSGAVTAPLNILVHNPAADKTGSVYMSGNALNSSTRGKSMLDDQWHVLVFTFDSLATISWVDGYLTNTQTTGNMLLNKLITPVVGDTFSGSLAELIFLNKRIDQNTIHNLTQQLARKWSIDIDSANVSNGPASTVNEDTVTADGSTIRIWTPPVPAENTPLILFCHPQGQTEKVNSATFAFPLIHAAVSMGWYVAGSSMGTVSTPGGTASSWGNPTAQAALRQLYDLMMTRHNFTSVILLGASMGGFASALAVTKNTIPNVKGVYFIDPALSLLSMYRLSAYTSTVDAGYSIVAGTLSGAVTAGANSVLSTVSFPAGTKIIIDPLGANPEQLTTGSPSGAGPFTIPITTPLGFNHSSGVKISDYGTKTLGFDAMLESKEAFSGIALRFVASSTDTITVQSNHTTPFQAQVSGIASESAIVQHLGLHLNGGATQSKDFVDFVTRAID